MWVQSTQMHAEKQSGLRLFLTINLKKLSHITGVELFPGILTL